MEKRIVSIIQGTSFVLLVFLFFWILLMILVTSDVRPDWTSLQYLQFAKNNGILYVISYLNALVFTILTVSLFGLMYLFTKESKPVLSVLGLLFVPVYGVLNIFAYGSQISVVPQLLSSINLTEATECTLNWYVQWIQTKPDSIIGIINGAGYAVLGIPSVCFGLALFKLIPYGKVIGWLLFVNAMFCWVGLVGYISGSTMLANGVLAGGFLYTVAVFYIFLGFRSLHQVYKKT